MKCYDSCWDVRRFQCHLLTRSGLCTATGCSKFLILLGPRHELKPRVLDDGKTIITMNWPFAYRDCASCVCVFFLCSRSRTTDGGNTKNTTRQTGSWPGKGWRIFYWWISQGAFFNVQSLQTLYTSSSWWRLLSLHKMLLWLMELTKDNVSVSFFGTEPIKSERTREWGLFTCPEVSPSFRGCCNCHFVCQIWCSWTRHQVQHVTKSTQINELERSTFGIIIGAKLHPERDGIFEKFPHVPPNLRNQSNELENLRQASAFADDYKPGGDRLQSESLVQLQPQLQNRKKQNKNVGHVKHVATNVIAVIGIWWYMLLPLSQASESSFTNSHQLRR